MLAEGAPPEEPNPLRPADEDFVFFFLVEFLDLAMMASLESRDGALVNALCEGDDTNDCTTAMGVVFQARTESRPVLIMGEQPLIFILVNYDKK